MTAWLHRLPRAAAALGLVIGLATPAAGANDDDQLTVVATIAQIGQPLTEIAGPDADVTYLMGAGTDPHDYQLTRRESRLMREADIIFHNGLNLEAQLRDSLRRHRARKPVIAVAEAVPQERRRAWDEQPNYDDPHVWMAPELWRIALERAVDALAEHDPAHAQGYRQRAAAYFEKLTELRDYLARITASVPEPQRILVTAHDAFGYFGQAFDFEVAGIQGISTRSEAGLRRIERLVDLLVENEIAAVFTETSVNDRNIQALIEGAAQRGHEVRHGGALYSDAMGPRDTYAGTYIGMLDANVTRIVRHLGGEAPPRGLNGKLDPIAVDR